MKKHKESLQTADKDINQNNHEILPVNNQSFDINNIKNSTPNYIIPPVFRDFRVDLNYEEEDER